MCVSLAQANMSEHQQFLEKYKNRFLQHFDSSVIAARLSMEGLIPPGLTDRLKSMHYTEGNGLLFQHLQNHANTQSIIKLCNIMINNVLFTGYPHIQQLGRDMLADEYLHATSSTNV
jgi:hypothetical protein